MRYFFAKNVNSSANISILKILFSKHILQDDITTLKISDIALMKDQNYELSLQMKSKEHDSDVYDYSGLKRGIWFGILRFAECSNYGIHIYYVIYN